MPYVTKISKDKIQYFDIHPTGSSDAGLKRGQVTRNENKRQKDEYDSYIFESTDHIQFLFVVNRNSVLLS